MEDKVIEVQRPQLVGQHIGSTGPKTQAVIDRAMGGVLFVDEAYRLHVPGCEKDFGREAVETLMSAMHPSKEPGKVNPVMVFAGYTEPMNAFMEVNDGISRRIGPKLKFSDYTCKELADIMELKLASNEINYPDGEMNEIFAGIFNTVPGEIRKKYNASLCQILYDEIIYAQEARLDPDSFTLNDLNLVLLCDIYRGGKQAVIKVMKREKVRFVEKATQAPEQVMLQVPGVGLLFGSP